MSFTTATIIIEPGDGPPEVDLNGDLAAVRLPGGVSIVLASRLTPTGQAAYLRDWAERLNDLAIRVERANAEQVPA